MQSFFGLKITEQRGVRRKEGAERTIILANDETFGPLQLSTKAIATGKQEGSSQHVADSQGVATCKHPEGSGDEKLTEEMSGLGSIANSQGWDSS